MSEWKPGTVAHVTATRKASGVTTTFDRCIWDGVNREWVSGHSGRLYPDADMWDLDVRPLVVLDLDDFGWASMVLRNPGIEAMGTRNRIADQIESQTKPARIPEPTTLGAIVKNGAGLRWVRTPTGQWVSEEGVGLAWDYILGPIVLIREGLS